MSTFLTKYIESRDAKFFTLQDAGNGYINDSTGNTQIDITSIEGFKIELYNWTSGTETLTGSFEELSSDAQLMYNAINSSSGLYVFVDSSMTISLPTGKYVVLTQPTGGALTNFSDGVYKFKITFTDINGDTSTYIDSTRMYFTSLIRDAIVRQLKHIDWMLWKDKPCEWPLAWQIENIYRSLLYSAELDLKDDFLFILDKLQRIIYICTTTDADINNQCGCEDLLLIASNVLYPNSGQIV